MQCATLDGSRIIHGKSGSFERPVKSLLGDHSIELR